MPGEWPGIGWSGGRAVRSLHEARAAQVGLFVFRHDAEAASHFGIGLDEAAHVAAKTILVELVLGLDVPQAARIRRNLVGDDDPHHVAFVQAAGFHLEVDQPDADAQENARQEVVDADGERHDVVDLLWRCPAESRDVLFGHHGIVQRVVLVIEFDDRARKLRAFVDAEAGGKRTRRHISHHHLEGDDLDFADQLLAHVETADEMGRDADIVQILENILRNPVVQYAFSVDHFMLLGIEGGRIILEVLDERTWLRTFIEDLRLALINAAATIHRRVPWFEEIHFAEAPDGDGIRSWRGHDRNRPRLARNLSDPTSKHNAATRTPAESRGGQGPLAETFQRIVLWRFSAGVFISPADNTKECPCPASTSTRMAWRGSPPATRDFGSRPRLAATSSSGFGPPNNWARPAPRLPPMRRASFCRISRKPETPTCCARCRPIWQQPANKSPTRILPKP